jgi:hypothetical protein
MGHTPPGTPDLVPLQRGITGDSDLLFAKALQDHRMSCARAPGGVLGVHRVHVL